MDEFKAALGQYLVQLVDLPALEVVLERTLDADPNAAPEIVGMLDDLYRAGNLTPQIYATLKRRVVNVSVERTQHSSSGPGPEELPDGRTVLQSQPPGSPPHWAEPEDSIADDAKTVYQGASPPPIVGGSAAESEAAGTPAVGGDATELVGSGRLDAQTDAQTDAHSERRAGEWGQVSQPNRPAGETSGEPSDEVPDRRSADQSARAPEASGAVPSTGGSVSRSNWSHPSQWSGASSGAGGGQVTVGSVLRERFELVKQIGKGGMGTVFKALDLHRVASDDRHAFVAIKVLNEDFKRHPQSLQALQRESRKSQDLAHPNVVTVFDFDRDGDNAYIQMEYLEGEPLDGFIKRNPGGVPPARAIEMVESLGRGLAYAHDRGIIHSDFKPSNAFITKEGVVKIFDFGIARAAKRATDVSGETTVFDAGELGALTPAYASCEMYEGGDPDPRDDIYALAVVTYELLTGAHPFDKESSVKARDGGLVAKPIKGISRRQWHAIQSGLAFDREGRTATIAQFLDELKPRKLGLAVVASVAVAVIVATALVATWSQSGMQQLQVEELVEIIEGGPDQTITERLPEIRDLDPEIRARVFMLGGTTQDSLVDYYGRRIRQSFDTASERYDYAEAMVLVQELKAIFPDSARVAEVESAIRSDRDNKIAELYTDIDTLLESGVLVEAQGEVNVVAAVEVLRRIAPEDPRLDSSLIPIRFAQVSRSALQSQDVELALLVVEQGRALAPGDVALIDLQDRVTAEIDRMRSVERVATLEGEIVEAIGETTDPRSAERLKAALTDLASIDPDNATAARARGHLEQLIAEELGNLLGARGYDEGRRLLAQYEGVVSGAFIAAQRSSFDQAAERYLVRIDEALDALDSAIAAGRLTGDTSAVAALSTLDDIGVSPGTLDQARTRVANAFAQEARVARDAESWDAARGKIRLALDVGAPAPVSERLRRELEDIDAFEQMSQARSQQERERFAAELRQKEIDALAEQFAQTLAVAPFSVDLARQALDTLAELDQYEAPLVAGRDRLVERFATEVTSLKTDGQWDVALRLAEQAAQLMPDAAVLSELTRVTRTEVDAQRALAQTREAQRRRDELDRLMAAPSVDPSWDLALRDAMVAYAEVLGEDDAKVARAREGIAEIYVAEARRSRNNERLANAEQQLERAAEYAPGLEGVAIERRALAEQRSAMRTTLLERERVAEIDRLKQNLTAEARRKNVASAVELLERLRETAPDDPFVDGEGATQIATAYLSLADDELGGGRFDSARDLVARGRKFAPDMSGYTPLLERIEEAERAQAKRAVADVAANDERTLAGIRDALAASNVVNTELVSGALGDVERRSPKLFASEEPRMVESALVYVDAQATSNRKRAEVRLAALKTIFPENRQVQDHRLPDARVAASSDPCAVPGLVGAGSNRRATCRDNLTQGKRGPALVVIPSGGPFVKPTAVSKFEITVGEYNTYCELSGACELKGQSSAMPVTGISVQEAQAFAAWLSERSGASYRLPTTQEWEYAANANGAQPPKNFNCQVRQGGQLIKGLSLLPVNTGGANGWGLQNYVGNAREWARTDSGWETRGGAHTDNLGRCDVEYANAHSGQADEITGFRVIRELG